MPQFAIIDAPSIFGLRPTGVQYLPEALKAAGLLKKLKAEYAGSFYHCLIIHNEINLPYY
jgi:arginase